MHEMMLSYDLLQQRRADLLQEAAEARLAREARKHSGAHRLLSPRAIAYPLAAARPRRQAA
jgi:hypothetical protein